MNKSSSGNKIKRIIGVVVQEGNEENRIQKEERTGDSWWRWESYSIE